MAGERESCLAAGMDYFLTATKPVELAGLAATIEGCRNTSRTAAARGAPAGATR